MLRKSVAVAGMTAVTALDTAEASADTLKWQIRSTYPYRIYLEFYSQDYNRSWPGGGEVYVLEASRYHTHNLRCRRGEKICYGGWVTTDEGTYWGVGARNGQRCPDCCAVCGGGSRRITLSR